MTEWNPASAEKPRDLYGLIVWMAAPLRPAACAFAHAIRLGAGVSATTGERTTIHLLVSLAFGTGATVMVVLGAVPFHLIDFNAGTFLTSSDFGRVFWRVMEIPTKPLLWLGIGAGILFRMTRDLGEGPLHSFLFRSDDSGENRLVRLLAVLLVMAVIVHFVASFGRALVGFTSAALHEDGGGAALNLELAVSGLLGLVAFTFEPREYPPLHWGALQVITLHVGRVMDLWAWSAVLVLLFLRLPSIAIAIVTCFGAILVFSCLGMLELFGPGVATFRFPFADTLLEQVSSTIAARLVVPWWQVAVLLYRLEAIIMAVIVLWLVGAWARRWLVEAT